MVKYGHFDFVTLKWDDAVMQYKHFSIEFKKGAFHKLRLHLGLVGGQKNV